MTFRQITGAAVVLGVVLGSGWLARAYVPSYAGPPSTAATQTIAWPAGATINYRHWSGNATAANVTGGGADVAVNASLASIGAATGLTFNNTGTQASADAGFSSNGINLMTFGTSAANTSITGGAGGALAVCVFYYNTSSFVITEADIVFNDTVTFATNGSATGYDVQSVGTHECGHLVGLDHCPLCDATMFPFGFLGQLTPRTLEDDDRAGLRQLYPTAPVTNPLGYGAVSGTVQNGVGGNVAGAHVYLRDAIRGVIGASAVTKPNGTFSISGVEPGVYHVNVEPINGPMSTGDLGSGWTGVAFNTTFRSTILGGVGTPTTIAVKNALTTAVGTINVSLTAATLNPTAAFPMATAVGGFGFSTGQSVELAPGYTQWLGIVGAGFNILPDAAFSFDSPFITITGPSTQSGATGGGYKIFPISVATQTPPGGYAIMISNGGETAFASGMITVTVPASLPAFTQSYGVSCPSTGAITLAPQGVPSLGNANFQLRCSGTTPGRAVFFALSNAPDALVSTGNFNPASSCTVYVDIDRFIFPFPGITVTAVTSLTIQPLPVPNVPSLAGIDVYAQCGEFDMMAASVKLTNAQLLALR
jgi:hypothetical protein